MWLANMHKTSLVLHLLAGVHLGYTVYYEYLYVQMPYLAIYFGVLPTVGGKFKYLTFLNGVLQCIYYLIAILHDLLRLRRLRQLRDYLLASLVLPLALTVSLTFWTLCVIDGESIFPSFIQVIYPEWLNWTMHCGVSIYPFLDLYISAHQYPKRSHGLSALTTALLLYLIWMYYVVYSTGKWIYPFLGALLPVTRICFFAVVIVAAFGYYLVGERINYALWKSSRESGP